MPCAGSFGRLAGSREGKPQTDLLPDKKKYLVWDLVLEVNRGRALSQQFNPVESEPLRKHVENKVEVDARLNNLDALFELSRVELPYDSLEILKPKRSAVSEGKPCLQGPEHDFIHAGNSRQWLR
jgi:hypothetical protein